MLTGHTAFKLKTLLSLAH